MTKQKINQLSRIIARLEAWQNTVRANCEIEQQADRAKSALIDALRRAEREAGETLNHRS
jgi:hypothetical protein